MLKSIGDIWFGLSREVGCFSEGFVKSGFTAFHMLKCVVKCVIVVLS